MTVRWQLLQELRRAPTWSLLVTASTYCLTAALPSVGSLALGRMVADASDGDASSVTGSAFWWLVVVAVALSLPRALDAVLNPVRRYTQERLTESLRAETRDLVLRIGDIEAFDDQQFRTDVFTTTRGLGAWSWGLGVEGQLAMARWGARMLIGAAVIAVYSWWLGAVVLSLATVNRRFVLGFHKEAATEVVVPQQAGLRELRYWARLVGIDRGAVEARTFGFGPWAISHQQGVSKRTHDLSSQYVRSILPRQWPAFVIGSAAIGVPMWTMLVWADAGFAASDVATVLAATFAVLLPGGGDEPYAYAMAIEIEGARQRLRSRLPTDKDSTRRLLANPVSPTTEPSAIRFESVSFRYPGTNRYVLREIDFEIRSGETIAIVGENGSGKTTLTRLLLGMYRPTAGRITAQGVELAESDIATWQSRVAMVLQDFPRFELSVNDNVGFTELANISDVRVERALRLASADSLSVDADQLLTRRFDNGVQLSGGQWQRVALARCFYGLQSGRDVLILDEPTSCLDVRAELSTVRSVLQHAGEATVLLLSHRFTTVRQADRILVLADGAIREDGTHDELLDLGGRYARMFQTQARAYQSNADGARA